DPREHVVTEEDASEQRDEPWVQGVERRRRAVVAVLGDAYEEDAVPACPDVGERPEIVDQRRVPAARPRIAVRLAPVEREHRSEPDEASAPHIDAEHETG